MAYRIIVFGSLAVPEYITQGDTQDMGTGQALTSFLPLPGGGFYDNYGTRKSPQGIRPISKAGVFWGTSDELEEELLAWRALIGTRERLTIQFDSGLLLWQLARLQNISTPRPSQAKEGWQRFTMTWITIAQNWRAVTADDWTWGDGSWAWGDGSVEFGVGSQIFPLTSADETITIVHGGNIDATGVLLRFDLVGAWQDLTIINETTGQQIVLDRPSSVASTWLEIDAGAMKMQVGGSSGERAINYSYRSLNTLTVQTVAAHDLEDGEMVRLSGTTLYDGDFYPVTVTNTTTYTVPIKPSNRAYGIATGGMMQHVFEAYPYATFSDIERWMVLAPGDNTLRLIWSPFPTTATLTAYFVDHYG